MTGHPLRPFRSRAWLASLLGAALLASACGADDAEVETAVTRGKRVYGNVCATCHAGNPAEEGVLGPAIAGASEELIRARVIDGGYTPGYTPKRNTKQMVALPHLEPVIGDLAAYLASVEP